MMEIVTTNTFKKQLRNVANNIKLLKKLEKIIDDLVSQNPILLEYKDHKLKGHFAGYRELHISPDVLLIYEIDEKERVITLAYIGSHSDLF